MIFADCTVSTSRTTTARTCTLASTIRPRGDLWRNDRLPPAKPLDLHVWDDFIIDLRGARWLDDGSHPWHRRVGRHGRMSGTNRPNSPVGAKRPSLRTSGASATGSECSGLTADSSSELSSTASGWMAASVLPTSGVAAGRVLPHSEVEAQPRPFSSIESSGSESRAVLPPPLVGAVRSQNARRDRGGAFRNGFSARGVFRIEFASSARHRSRYWLRW
jgi:hypothetical protein